MDSNPVWVYPVTDTKKRTWIRFVSYTDPDPFKIGTRSRIWNPLKIFFLGHYTGFPRNLGQCLEYTYCIKIDDTFRPCSIIHNKRLQVFVCKFHSNIRSGGSPNPILGIFSGRISDGHPSTAYVSRLASICLCWDPVFLSVQSYWKFGIKAITHLLINQKACMVSIYTTVWSGSSDQFYIVT